MAQVDSMIHGMGAVWIGVGSSAVDTAAAIGDYSQASGLGSSAYGFHATATATNSTAIGAYSEASGQNSTAIGTGAVASLNNQVVIGTQNQTVAAPGITSGLSKARQNGPLEIVTSDNGGNLATAGAGDLGLATQSQLNSVSNRTDEAVTGVAMAFAMAGSTTLMPGEKFAFTSNWGTFQGENGVAADAAIRVASNVQLNGAVAVGLGENIAGGRVGLRVGW